MVSPWDGRIVSIKMGGGKGGEMATCGAVRAKLPVFGQSVPYV